MPALTTIGRIIEVVSVKAENISIYVVPDDAQSVDLIIGRTWLDLPHIAYTKIGERVHIGYREDELFRNFPIDEKVNPVCLERLETAQSESESLQIKDTSQQKKMGNLADDLKMKENKNVDNLKSISNSLVKTNSYYDKNKSGKVSLRKGDIVAVRRKPNTTGESTKTQPRYRGPMVVTEVRPSNTYRISQLEPRKGRPYVTIVHVSQLKAWRSWNEDDDESSTNSHKEPEMQRSKRTYTNIGGNVFYFEGGYTVNQGTKAGSDTNPPPDSPQPPKRELYDTHFDSVNKDLPPSGSMFEARISTRTAAADYVDRDAHHDDYEDRQRSLTKRRKKEEFLKGMAELFDKFIGTDDAPDVEPVRTTLSSVHLDKDKKTHSLVYRRKFK
ncbi:hypothetical protein AVEN_55077-1 [Araneus ventricosus]|uniref:Uncharacterized protein n=1 Tax=Araneus ventricosus TaxID=182803 RepID=A0A4Y2VV22_ARAVE|nr:hypothetical protein AVEN_55077-1 [Araneus ventricosus]